MGIKKIAKKIWNGAREFNSANYELHKAIFEARARDYQRSLDNGSLERTIKIAVPVSGLITLAGLGLDNKYIAEFGLGATLMGCLYGLTIERYKARKNKK